MAKALGRRGHRLDGSSVYRMPLDLARNEMLLVFLSTTADYNLLLDDDVQITPEEGILDMLALMQAPGVEVVSAPCRLRDHAHGGAQDWSPFNIRPCLDGMFDFGEKKVVKCESTGLGAVLLSRKAAQALYDAEGAKYVSRLKPGFKAAPVFASQVVSAKEIDPSIPDDQIGVYLLDDMVFSRKLRALGFDIYALLDVQTKHDGMVGCFRTAMEGGGTVVAVPSASLLGADGRPL